MTKELASPSPMPAPSDRVSLREASRLLNVTRAFVTQLAESGQLGPQVGLVTGERLYARAVVLAYRAKMRMRQAEGLKKMIEATERAGLYEDQCMEDLLEFAASRTMTVQEQGGELPMVESRVGRSGKATVPARVLRALRAEPGTQLKWSVLSDGTVIVRAKTSKLHQLAGILTRPEQPSISLKEMKR